MESHSEPFGFAQDKLREESSNHAGLDSSLHYAMNGYATGGCVTLLMTYLIMNRRNYIIFR